MNMTALQAALNMLADAINDVMGALQPGQNVVQQVLAFENLVPDLFSLLPQLGMIPSEVSSLKPEDYIALVKGLVSELHITDDKAKSIIAAGMQLLSDLVVYTVPDVESLVAAIKS